METRLIISIIIGLLVLIGIIGVLYVILKEKKRRDMEYHYKLPDLEEEKTEETKFNVIFDENKISFKTHEAEELQEKLLKSQESTGVDLDEIFEEVEKNYKVREKVYLPNLNDDNDMLESQIINEEPIQNIEIKNNSQKQFEDLLEELEEDLS